MSTEHQTPTARVRALHCSLFPPHVLRRVSAVHVTEPELMDRLRQMPNPNGMLDLNMGPSHKGLGCSTCANDHLECQGHLGHIELPVPCFGAAMIRYIYSLVKVICPFCCRLMLTYQERDQLKNKTERFLSGLVAQSTFALATKQAKNKHNCPHADCGMPQPKYSLDQGNIRWQWENDDDVEMMTKTGWGDMLERPFSAREALAIFDGVSRDDWRLLGLSADHSHPSWMISTCVAVLPNCLRPTDRARNQYNDITLLGEAIVRYASALKKAILEHMPSWVPKTVVHLNEWLDEAVETMLANDINVLSSVIDYSKDSAEIVSIAQLQSNKVAYQAFEDQANKSKKRKQPVKTSRRGQRVSFLAQALNAAYGAIYAYSFSRAQSKSMQGMDLGMLPGVKWSQVNVESMEIPHHVLAGWSSVSFNDLVAKGPRPNIMSDWLRLVPFVMWAACYLIPEFVYVSSKPEIVESLWIPNEETVAWIMSHSDKLVTELQLSVVRMISNDGRVVPKQVVHSGRFLSSLMSHLQGKEGWFRMFMCGKRVDFSARSVVTPGAQLDAHELGVPVSIAKVLTLPEMVLPFSKLRLQEAVVNGHNSPRGAARVIEPNGRIHYLEFMPAMEDRIALAYKLEQGWTVERTLRDGDFTLFNRYPSLHRMSIYGHKVKVLQDNAEGIRSSRKAPLAYALSMVTAGYFNADCDGDEMNQHLPQTAMSYMEVRHLFNVESIYLTPYSHRAGIGLIQNSILLSYLISCKDVLLTEAYKLRLESSCHYGVRDSSMLAACESSKGRLWTGKYLISQTFSPHLDLAKTADFPATKIDVGFDDSVAWPKWLIAMMHPSESQVLIYDGQMLSGRLCSKTVGKSAMSIVDVMVRDVSRRAVTKFLSDAYRMLETFATMRGFSLGIDDCFVSERAQKAIDAILTVIDKLPAAHPLVQGYEQTEDYAKKEYALRVATQKIIDIANSVMLDDLMQTKRAKENGFLAMIGSGAKGKIMNLQSALTCIGQVVINGTRVHRSIFQGKPFYLQATDTKARSSGFVKANYARGVSAEEIIGSFFAGRESIVDTGINTSRTGYAYRRIIKGIENYRVALDGSVRDGQYIVYRVYGGAGANPEWFETITLKTYAMSKEIIEQKTIDMFATKAPEDGDEFGQDEMMQMHAIKDAWHRAALTVLEFSLTPFLHDSNTPAKGDKELKTITTVPFERLMSKYMVSQTIDMERFTVCFDHEERALLEVMLENPVELYGRVFEIYLRLDGDFCSQGGACASGPTRLHMWESLHALIEANLVEDDYGEIIEYERYVSRLVRALVYTYADARTRWIRSRIESGEQCGILAAYSIGEPTTQMTLNTFHNVGRGSENLQIGVPRLTEILDMTLKMKTPSMVVFPKQGVDLKKLESYFKGATLTQLLKQVEVIRDIPSWTHVTCIPEDKEWMTANRDYFGPDFDDDDIKEADGRHVVASTRDYVIRYELDADKVHASKVPIVEIAHKLRDEWAARPENTWESIFVTFTPVPLAQGILVIRVRCTGVRCLSIELPSDAYIKSTYRYLGGFLRKLALYSQRSIKFGLSTSLRGVSICAKATVSNVESGRIAVDSPALTTRGTCLAQLQSIRDVDWKRCLTNNILEAYETLGIGAARTLIVYELTKIMSCDGSYVAFPHIWAVADCIVFRGFPMRFSRHGQNRVDTSILQRASFEESAEYLVNAAIFCEDDPLQGITPNLIIGQVVPAGTGSVGVHGEWQKSKIEGVDTLMNAASIDLDMTPSVVTAKTMGYLDKDRVDNRTGVLRPWTRRIRHVDRDKVRASLRGVSTAFGLKRTRDGRDVGKNESVAYDWLANLDMLNRGETSLSSSTVSVLMGSHYPMTGERKRVRFSQEK